MTGVFQESPNIVHILIEDANKKTERFVAGRTLVDVIERIEAALKDPTEPAKPHKARRPRRTKAQMQVETHPDGQGTQAEPKLGPGQVVGSAPVPVVSHRRTKVWTGEPLDVPAAAPAEAAK